LVTAGRGRGSGVLGSERLLQGRFGLCSEPLPAESSTSALDDKLAWRRCLLTFPGWGLTFLASCWRGFRAASAPRGHAPSPRPPSRVRSARWFRATSRGVVAARRPLSLPAGDSLTQRVGRLVPCRGWKEDMRGEPGCGGNAVSSPGAAGCR